MEPILCFCLVSVHFSVFLNGTSYTWCPKKNGSTPALVACWLGDSHLAPDSHTRPLPAHITCLCSLSSPGSGLLRSSPLKKTRHALRSPRRTRKAFPRLPPPRQVADSWCCDLDHCQITGQAPSLMTPPWTPPLLLSCLWLNLMFDENEIEDENIYFTEQLLKHVINCDVLYTLIVVTIKSVGPTYY